MGRLTFLVLVFSLPAEAVASTVTIHDQTFLSTAWDVRRGNGTNFGSASASRVVGAGITGDAQSTIATRAAGASSFTYEVDHFKTDAVFNPATDGVLESVRWELWYKFSGAQSTYGVINIIARQGAGTYVSGGSRTEPANASSFWQKGSGTVSASNFGLARGSGPAGLDFTPCALPIQFGYMNSSGVFLSVSQVNYLASFFDLQLTSTPPLRIGDVDGDLEVDRADAATVARNFGKATAAGYHAGDFDCDGQVSLADLGKLQGNLTPPQAFNSVVPEPEAGLLSAIAMGCALGMRTKVNARRKRAWCEESD